MKTHSVTQSRTFNCRHSAPRDFQSEIGASLADLQVPRIPPAQAERPGQRVALIANSLKDVTISRASVINLLTERGHTAIALAPGVENTVQGNSIPAISLVPGGIAPLTDLRSALSIRRALQAFRPDQVILVGLKPIIYGTFAALQSGVKRISSTVNGLGLLDTENKSAHPILWRLVRSMARQAFKPQQTVFFQNPDDALRLQTDRLVTNKQARLVNGSGVDLDLYRPGPPIQQVQTFLLPARLVTSKGVEDFIAAAHMLNVSIYPTKFLICGPLFKGPGAIPLAAIKSAEQRGIIKYLGDVPDLNETMNSADVVVLPSRTSEGMPRVLLEAMAKERAIITTNVPGNRHAVIAGHNGFLVPPGNPSMLAHAMLELIKNPQQAASMGRNGRELATTFYDIKKVAGHIAAELLL